MQHQYFDMTEDFDGRFGRELRESTTFSSERPPLDPNRERCWIGDREVDCEGIYVSPDTIEDLVWGTLGTILFFIFLIGTKKFKKNFKFSRLVRAAVCCRDEARCHTCCKCCKKPAWTDESFCCGEHILSDLSDEDKLGY